MFAINIFFIRPPLQVFVNGPLACHKNVESKSDFFVIFSKNQH